MTLADRQVQSRAEQERCRAARTAEIAERHERWVDNDPFLRALHLRMATIHRQVQCQHLTAAALHAARAERVRTGADLHLARARPGLPADREDRSQMPAASHRDAVHVHPGQAVGLASASRHSPRNAAGVTTSTQNPPATNSQSLTVLETLVESLELRSDIATFLSGLVARCVALLDVTAAALLLTGHRGGLGTATCSSEPARLFTAAELTRATGPSVQCHLTGTYHAYPTISALAACWPHLAHTATAAGIAAVYTVPVRHHGQPLGVLTLLDHQPHRMGDEALGLVSLLAAAASIGLTNQRAIGQHQRVAAQLQYALTSRVTIEQAKGMLAERLGIAPDAAFELLRSHSRANNRNLHEIAARIIDHRLEIVPPGPDRTASVPRTPQVTAGIPSAVRTRRPPPR